MNILAMAGSVVLYCTGSAGHYSASRGRLPTGADEQGCFLYYGNL